MQYFRNWFNQRFSDPQVVILFFLLVIGTLIILTLGKLLAPVLASIVIAYLLEGIVVFFQRLRTPRMIAVLLVFTAFLTALFFLLFSLMPKISTQVGGILADLPAIAAAGQQQLIQLPEKYPDFISPEQITDFTRYLQTEIGRMGQRILSFSVASVRGIFSFIIYLVLLPFMVFFFLKDKKVILDWVNDLLPEDRDLSRQVWRQVDLQIGNYIRGKFWEILIIWGISYVVFLFLGLDYAMLISLLVGLSVLVPYIGVTVTTLPVAMMGFFQWGLSSEFIYLLIAYGIIQLFDGNILAPLLLADVVNLHPIAIIVSVVLFGGLWGFWGVFFAIPLATLVEAVLKVWQNAQGHPDLAEIDAEAKGEPRERT